MSENDEVTEISSDAHITVDDGDKEEARVNHDEEKHDRQESEEQSDREMKTDEEAKRMVDNVKEKDHDEDRESDRESKDEMEEVVDGGREIETIEEQPLHNNDLLRMLEDQNK